MIGGKCCCDLLRSDRALGVCDEVMRPDRRVRFLLGENACAAWAAACAAQTSPGSRASDDYLASVKTGRPECRDHEGLARAP